MEIQEILEALLVEVPEEKNCVHIIWIQEGRKPRIELNRRKDSIHGQVNDEIGFSLYKGKLNKIFE